MGLIALPTMLRYGYSREISTGVIATSGTLGQIIPPSIVLVLLGSIVGDMYAIGQETRAKELGTSVIEMLGKAAVISTGTLFKAAFVPGLVLAFLYAAYAFVFALMRPRSAPPVLLEKQQYDLRGKYGGSIPLAVAAVVGPPVFLILLWVVLGQTGIVGSKSGIEGSPGAPISSGIMTFVVLVGILYFLALTLRPHHSPRPLLMGLGSLILMLIVDWSLITAEHSAGTRFVFMALPVVGSIYALRHTAPDSWRSKRLGSSLLRSSSLSRSWGLLLEGSPIRRPLQRWVLRERSCWRPPVSCRATSGAVGFWCGHRSPS